MGVPFANRANGYKDYEGEDAFFADSFGPCGEGGEWNKG